MTPSAAHRRPSAAARPNTASGRRPGSRPDVTPSSPETSATAASVQRTCVGCGQREDGEALVRLVLAVESTELGDGASVVVDAKGGAFGRGAHVHPSLACLDKAERGLSRAFRCKVVAPGAALAEAVAVAYTRRLAGLLGGGARAGLIAIGTDAVTDALREGRAGLLIVAGDAAAAAQRVDIARAIGEGRSLALWDRRQLALALGRSSAAAREGVAVAGILDRGLAHAIRAAWLAATVRPDVRPGGATVGIGKNEGSESA